MEEVTILPHMCTSLRARSHTYVYTHIYAHAQPHVLAHAFVYTHTYTHTNAGGGEAGDMSAVRAEGEVCGITRCMCTNTTCTLTRTLTLTLTLAHTRPYVNSSQTHVHSRTLTPTFRRTSTRSHRLSHTPTNSLTHPHSHTHNPPHMHTRTQQEEKDPSRLPDLLPGVWTMTTKQQEIKELLIELELTLHYPGSAEIFSGICRELAHFGPKRREIMRNQWN